MRKMKGYILKWNAASSDRKFVGKADDVLTYEVYESNMDDKAKEQSFTRWRRSSKVMLATSAFGVGVD